MRYRPDLDGIRALAVLAVIASHTGIRLTEGGWLGVDVFFVLSGYLITTLLITEREATNTVSLRDFYLRRILRLYPALAALLIMGCLFYRDLGEGGTVQGYLAAVAVAGLYVEDFFQGLGHHPIGSFGHTWSLAVEEQFYLLWPPIFVWARRRGGDPLKWAFGGAVVAWILGGIYAFHPGVDGIPDGAYYLPWCRFSQILAGCSLALLLRRGVRAPHPLGSFAVGVSTCVGLMALVLAASRFGRTGHLAWEAPASAILTCLLLWHLAESPDGLVRKVLGIAPLAWIGRRSYGVYLINLPVLVVLAAHLHVRRIELVGIALLVTFALAALSYRFVELPMLRLKDRFQPVQSMRAVALREMPNVARSHE